MSEHDKLLCSKRSKSEDFYALLNCDENSTHEEITAQFNILALKYDPDQPTSNQSDKNKFDKIAMAKETLCDPDKKLNYDKWRNTGMDMSFINWSKLKENIQQPVQWGPGKTKDRIMESGGSSGPASLAAYSPAHRRASEGGASLHWSGRGTGKAWTETPAAEEAGGKFKNNEI